MISTRLCKSARMRSPKRFIASTGCLRPGYIRTILKPETSNRRLGVLFLLYKQRRANPENPSVSLLELEALMGTPREHLVFTTWYLREKNFVRLDERSSFVITAEGVDDAEKNLVSNRPLYKLLSKAKNSQESPQEFSSN
jgi:hypothetical protein